MIHSREVEEDERPTEPLDADLPTVDRAFESAIADSAIRKLLSDSDASTLGSLAEIQLLRHRRGRRCLLSYSFDGRGSGKAFGESRFIGKIRSKGVNRRSDGIARALRSAGFSETGPYGFTVAEPIGLVHELAMTLQRFYSGPQMTELASLGWMTSPRFEAVGAALAELHAAGVATDRRHTVGNELAILEDRLPQVGLRVPKFAKRIDFLIEAARPIAEGLVKRPVRPIHRDFYPDQVIDSFGELVLLDLDLYTMGDPALDVGNFVAHLREQALRRGGGEHAFRCLEDAFVDGYLAASSDTSREHVRQWTHLSLLRHIEISWRIDVRRSGLEKILELCERNTREIGAV